MKPFGLSLVLILSAGVAGAAPASSAQTGPPTHIPQPDFWIQSAPDGVPSYFVDSAVFPVSADSMRIEAYFRIGYDQLRFDQAGDAFRARVEFDLSVRGVGEKRARRSTSERVVETSREVVGQAGGYYLLNQVALVVARAPQRVECKVRLGDGGTAAAPAEAHWWNDLPASKVEGLVFGEVQITNQIAPLGAESEFPKGGVEFYPNPTRSFSEELSTLVFYCESWNSGTAPRALHLRYGIEDLYGVDHWGGEGGRVDGGVNTLEPGSSVTLSGFNISSLDTGFYRLVLEFLDSSGAFVERRTRIFSFVATGEALSAPDPYVSTLDAQLLESFEDRFLRYLGSPGDRDRYASLAAGAAQRRFIEGWWKRLAEKRGVPIQALRADYLRRYELADERFTEPHRAGWRTDRGRILIIYGEPAEIIREDFGALSRAGRLWEMVVRGERKFCYFLDRRGTGDYALEATDIEGEAAASRVRPTLTVGTESLF